MSTNQASTNDGTMNKAVVSLTTGLEDPEKVTVAFLVSVGAAEQGRDTMMFLTKEAVRLATGGVATGVACEGCPPLPTLLERYTAAGGRYPRVPHLLRVAQPRQGRPHRQRRVGRDGPAVGVDRRPQCRHVQLLTRARAVTDALAAWGAHDRDNPFPLYAALRARSPVHSATLADGHPAWLIVGFDEARAALNETRLSKDMHAALATSDVVVAEGLPGPALARHMLVVDPPDHTRLRRLVAAAFSVRRIEELRPHVQTIVDDLLDAVAAAGPDATVDLVSALAFPAAVHGDLRAPRRRRGRPGRAGPATHRAVEPDRDRGRIRGREAGVGRGRLDARRARRRQTARARRSSGERVDPCSGRRRTARPARVAVDDLPVDRRRSRHDR